MMKIISIFFLVIVLFINCVTDQQDSCRSKIARADADMEACFSTLLGAELFISTSKNPNNVGYIMLNIGLARCALAVQNEKMCNKKSKYLPVFQQNSN